MLELRQGVVPPPHALLPTGHDAPPSCPPPPPPNPAKEAVEIVDIRTTPLQASLRDGIVSMLKPGGDGPRQLPTMLLYDQRGLQLFEAITYLDEYYLTKSEVAVLEKHASDIAAMIPPGSLVLELGSGNLRKVNLLLRALDDAGKNVDYYALDLSLSELERTLAQLPRYRRVVCHGLWGTYDDGQAWLAREDVRGRPKAVLHMGSSIGNFDREDAVRFLAGFAKVLCEGDRMVVGIDGCVDGGKVFDAYNDQAGVTHEFILNGLQHANDVLGENVFKRGEWKATGEYVYDESGSRHQAFLSPLRDVEVLGTLLRPHERIRIEQSFKYSKRELDLLWDRAGLGEVTSWMTEGGEYGLHMLEKPRLPFGLSPSAFAPSPVPSFAEWESLWSVWDAVTTQMLPQDALLSKPIRLRNACIFYLGHIPAFLDIQLTKTIPGTAASEPAWFASIFERGIDPDVDNPELCHAHSEIPDEWPPVGEILEYRDAVRARLRAVYERAEAGVGIGRTAGRGIWVAFEHEAMHVETLLYMMLQSDATAPPPGVAVPDFELMAKETRRKRVENEWHRVPGRAIRVGTDDPEGAEDHGGHYGWDNEKPARIVTVPWFEIKGRPITNEEYAKYMETRNISQIPASWAHLPGNATTPASTSIADRIGQSCLAPEGAVSPAFLRDKAARTVFGLVPLRHALDWPVFASHDELAGCAAWMGGRIPTADEVRSAYAYADHLKKKADAERQLGRTVPAVNAHLLNDGVEETPPSRETTRPGVGESSGTSSLAGASADETATKRQQRQPSEDPLFSNLEGANVGFRHWHPVPVTTDGRLCGRGEMGGGWEWTATVLEKHDGFEPMALYPAYTVDFCDGKHNIVLGGSWATHPRIAGRQSFVNWYQRNYPYAWVGARMARDVQD